MGNLLVQCLIHKRCIRTVMIGLDNAGKTTILYSLKLNAFVHTSQTLGFNNETFKYQGMNFSVWDVGGHYFVRPLWQYYYESVDAVIFVIDANDDSRISEACEELIKVFEHAALKDAIFLILVNKIDLYRVIDPKKLCEIVNLDKSRNWMIQACSVVTKEGLSEGFKWLIYEYIAKQHGFKNSFKLQDQLNDKFVLSSRNLRLYDSIMNDQSIISDNRDSKSTVFLDVFKRKKNVKPKVEGQYVTTPEPDYSLSNVYEARHKLMNLVKTTAITQGTKKFRI